MAAPRRFRSRCARSALVGTGSKPVESRARRHRGAGDDQARASAGAPRGRACRRDLTEEEKRASRPRAEGRYSRRRGIASASARRCRSPARGGGASTPPKRRSGSRKKRATRPRKRSRTQDAHRDEAAPQGREGRGGFAARSRRARRQGRGSQGRGADRRRQGQGRRGRGRGRSRRSRRPVRPVARETAGGSAAARRASPHARKLTVTKVLNADEDERAAQPCLGPPPSRARKATRAADAARADQDRARRRGAGNHHRAGTRQPHGRARRRRRSRR